jgi:hypothetical protein
MQGIKLARIALVLPVALAGCGAVTPEMEILPDKTPDDPYMHSRQGKRENKLLAYVQCEVQKGLWRVWSSPKFRDEVPWLFYRLEKGRLIDGAGNPAVLHDKHGNIVHETYSKKTNDPGWGVSVYLQMQVDEQSQINPGFGLNEPFHNAYGVTAGAASLPLTPAGLAAPTISAIPQFFSLGVGVGAATRATRLEAVQFTLPTGEFWKVASKQPHGPNGEYDCSQLGGDGVFIYSDLKIDDFIVDKATIAASGNSLVDTKGEIRALYNTYQETINFVASFSGGVTPSWKFARTSVNPNTPMVSAQRDEINTLIVTFGQMKPDAGVALFTPPELSGSGATQHNNATAAALYGNATRSVAP